jgi:hypothetical protein
MKFSRISSSREVSDTVVRADSQVEGSLLERSVDVSPAKEKIRNPGVSTDWIGEVNGVGGKNTKGAIAFSVWFWFPFSFC